MLSRLSVACRISPVPAAIFNFLKYLDGREGLFVSCFEPGSDCNGGASVGQAGIHERALDAHFLFEQGLHLSWFPAAA